MTLTNLYKIMCQKAWVIQQNWQPKTGDSFILSANYCSKETCTEGNVCTDCLETGNVYVLANDHYNKVFFFNPTLCNRDGGILLNDTRASIFVPNNPESFHFALGIHSSLSHQERCVWLPSQKDLQEMYTDSDFFMSDKVHAVHDLMDDFLDYLSVTPTGIFTSTEEYWLNFYMNKVHNCKWSNHDWIKLNT